MRVSIAGEIDQASTTALLDFLAAEEAQKLDGDSLQGVSWRISFRGIENGGTDVGAVDIGMFDVGVHHY